MPKLVGKLGPAEVFQQQGSVPKNEVPLDTSPGDSYISVLVDMLFDPLHGSSLLPPLSQYDVGLFLMMERPNPSLQAGVWVESRSAPGGL